MNMHVNVEATDDYRLVVETNGVLPEAIGGESVAVGDGAYVVEFESAAAQNAAFNTLSSDGSVSAVSKDAEFSIV